MKIILAAALSVCVSGEVAASAQNRPTLPTAIAELPSARGDLALLRNFLSRDRSYSPAARTAANAMLDAAEPTIDSLTPLQVALLAARVAALSGNGHTDTGLRMEPRIPYRLWIIEDRVHVLDSAGDAEVLGAELLSIDGVPIGQIRETASLYRGGLQAHKDQILTAYIEMPAVLQAMGLISRADAVNLRLRTRDGEVVERTLQPQASPWRPGLRASGLQPAAPSGAPQPLYLRQPMRQFLTADVPDMDALYITMRAVTDVGEERIADFLAATTAELETKRPRNIILDLRLNGGGDLNKARNFAKALPDRLPDGGRIFAITSGGTFSAAISTLGYLKETGGDRVVIVGEPVGDDLEFWAEGPGMRLPYAELNMGFATERHNYQTGCPETDCHGSIRRNPIRVATLQPDVAAPLTAEAWLAGRDPAMEAIAAYLAR